MRFLKNYAIAVVATTVTFVFMSAVVAETKPAGAAVSANSVQDGFRQAQACEPEIDDDLTSYGECIGHAADRMTQRQLSWLGLYFQAWLISDLAARQASIRSRDLRKRYFQLMSRGLRATGWSVQQLCTAKQLACEPIELRLRQKL